MTHAQIKKQLAIASVNWQMPAKIRRALSEPIPGVARFCMTHAHARSELNERSDGTGIGVQLKWDFTSGLLKTTNAQMPNARPRKKPLHGVKHGTIERPAAANENW